MSAKPTDSLLRLRGVGPAVAERLARLGVERPVDLLFLLPQRYEDRTRVVPLGSLRPGQRVVVEGEIALADVAFRRRRSLLVRLTDRTGQLTLRFFHFSRAQQDNLVTGARLRCYGEVRPGPLGNEMVHPEYRVLAPGQEPPLDERLTPVYPAVEGLAQFRLRDLTGQVLDRLLPQLPDALPATGVPGLELPGLADALRYVHRPPAGADLQLLSSGMHPCQRRLALEELLAQHLSLRQIRERTRQDAAVVLSAGTDRARRLRREFLASLGFELTGGQRAALADIDADVAGGCPMMRLVQGDVGCGKTVVAAAAALLAVAGGHQVAIMAPTELLAEQHARNFHAWLEPLGIRVALLTGRQTGKVRAALESDLASGAIHVAVGTHALFQEGVAFQRLVLAIVDEQHRFGVHQRLLLREKGRTEERFPHQLVMTATPIPRTLAMTAYADLDVSIIDELPPGRTPIKTVVLPDTRRAEIVERIDTACRSGRQAYWVCPLIDESDLVRYEAAEKTAAQLAEALPGVRIGLVHGRMAGKQKDAVMTSFKQGKLDLLVATTVIEVGVDVPNASLMVIENAERMGLAQLHQLRGRVGRGAVESTCVLLFQGPLSPIARERLGVLRETNDGFEVARRDLELRGPGELLGTRQTGLMQLRVADLVRDADLLPDVQRASALMLDGPQANIAGLVGRWVGAGERFRNV